jgi:hypothetical protein
LRDGGRALPAGCHRFDVQVDGAAARAGAEGDRDDLRGGLVRRVDPQAGGWDDAAGGRGEVGCLGDLQRRSCGLVVCQGDGAISRRAAGSGAAEPLAPKADRGHAWVADDGARLPGLVGELQGVEDAAGCRVAAGVYPNDETRRLARGSDCVGRACARASRAIGGAESVRAGSIHARCVLSIEVEQRPLR